MLCFLSIFKGALDVQDPLGLAGDNIPYGQFGRAIARVGDLNKDGFQGTVYLRRIILHFLITSFLYQANLVQN